MILPSMPTDRPTTVDALHLDAVLTLDVDHVSFVDAYRNRGVLDRLEIG